ncbi:hypothetical protein LOK46_29650 [Methylobacterium sp. NMS14P]|uniref:hypothetical protein n=1 Tax=Methylobacterium sp. NMS14P TaxID=2894310 RepID=UPI0023592B5A|nr:hypothetical protein [Methylobacterium sp. NMS14P]WCS25232.1 hypothetical protein LOK46_29650 [Methylobacterium sp. NMS14P]
MGTVGTGTLRLEGRYTRPEHEPPPLTLLCSSIRYREAEFKETKGAGGDVMRSVTVQPSLEVSGLPADFQQAKGDWTHIICALLPKGEGELVDIVPLGGDRARFVVKYAH